MVGWDMTLAVKMPERRARPVARQLQTNETRKVRQVRTF